VVAAFSPEVVAGVVDGADPLVADVALVLPLLAAISLSACGGGDEDGEQGASARAWTERDRRGLKDFIGAGLLGRGQQAV